MIVAAPAISPVTIPDVGITVAVEVSLLLHVPPTVVADNGVLLPAHTKEAPVTGTGMVLTLTGALT